MVPRVLPLDGFQRVILAIDFTLTRLLNAPSDKFLGGDVDIAAVIGFGVYQAQMDAGVVVLRAVAPVVKLERELLGQVVLAVAIDERSYLRVVVLEEDAHASVVLRHLGGTVHQVPLAGELAQLLALEVVGKNHHVARHKVGLGIDSLGGALGRSGALSGTLLFIALLGFVLPLGFIGLLVLLGGGLLNLAYRFASGLLAQAVQPTLRRHIGRRGN